MAYHIETSRFSFIQFAESDAITDCEFGSTSICLPAFDEDDAWFQFVLRGDTEEEADALCVINSEPVKIGIVLACSDGFLLQFNESPTRYRVSATKILYIWQHGLPAFDTVIDVAECFHIRIAIPSINTQSWCSNCFQRIAEDCHTSVIEYSNDENSFGFNYCAGEDPDLGAADCDPTILQFTDQDIITIPWTAFLQAKYGSTPNIQVWQYDNTGELVAAGIRVALDGYPPTELRIYNGGIVSGIIKIM